MVGEWTRTAAVEAIQEAIRKIEHEEDAYFVEGMIRMAKICGAIDDKQRVAFSYDVDRVAWQIVKT